MTQPKQPPSDQSAPKKGKTDSKAPEEPKIEDLIQTLNVLFGEIYPEIEVLNTLLRKQGKGPKPDFKTSLLHEDDLRVKYSIEVSTKSGQTITIEGDQTLHSILATDLLTEAPQSFQQMVTSNILRPLQVRFQALMDSRIHRQKPPEPLPRKSSIEILPPASNESKPTGPSPRADKTDAPAPGGS